MARPKRTKKIKISPKKRSQPSSLTSKTEQNQTETSEALQTAKPQIADTNSYPTDKVFSPESSDSEHHSPKQFKWRIGRLNIKETAFLIGLSFFVFGIYFNTLTTSFHLDDERAIWNNPAIFMKEVNWDSFIKAVGENTLGNRPVAHLSFALNYYFHGLDVAGYHIVNIIIHIITGILLFYFIKFTLRLSFREGESNKVFWISFFASAIWMVHPLQTQSVTYIVQRMNSMASMFYIIAMLCFIQARLTSIYWKKTGLITATVVAALLALGSKETALTLPLFILLYEWFFFQDMSTSFLRRIPFQVFTVGIAMTLIAIVFLGNNFLAEFSEAFTDKGFTLFQRLLTQPRVLLLYLSLIIFPIPGRLNLDYDFPLSFSITNPLVTLPAILLLLGMFGLAVVLARKERLYSFCILWFFGNLVIESSIIPLEMVFEHRTYLPSMMIILLIVLFSFRFLKYKMIYTVLLLLIIFTFSFWTIERNKIWKDEITLWSDCLKKSPNKSRVHNNMGNAYFREGKFKEANSHFERALLIDPGYSDAHVNLALSLRKTGDADKAIYHFRKALSFDPQNKKIQSLLQATINYASALKQRPTDKK